MAEKDIKIFRTRDNKYIRLSLIGIEFVIKVMIITCFYDHHIVVNQTKFTLP